MINNWKCIDVGRVRYWNFLIADGKWIAAGEENILRSITVFSGEKLVFLFFFFFKFSRHKLSFLF